MLDKLTTNLLLRLGVAFSFTYPAVSAWFDPYSWVGYFPAFLHDMAGAHDLALLHAFGVIEIALALWIVFGKRILIPSGIAATLLFLIVVFNPAQIDVLFRDIPIMLIALALALAEYRQRSLQV